MKTKHQAVKSKRHTTPPPSGTPAGFVTVQQAMKQAGCSEATIWRWIYQQRLHTLRVRKRVLVNKEDLVHWIRPRAYVPDKPPSMVARERKVNEPVPSGYIAGRRKSL